MQNFERSIDQLVVERFAQFSQGFYQKSVDFYGQPNFVRQLFTDKLVVEDLIICGLTVFVLTQLSQKFICDSFGVLDYFVSTF